MKKLDAITDFSRAQFARFFLLCKSFFSEKLMEKVENYLNLTNSLLVPLSAIIILISAVIFSIKMSTATPLLLAVLAVFFLFFGDFISEKFHGACKAAIKSNQTSISSNAYLELIVFLNVFSVIGLVLGGIYFAIDESSLTIFLGCLAAAVLILLSTVPVLNPHIINMSISTNSGAASDLVGIIAISLKTLLYYSKLFSRLVIIVGGVIMVIAAFGALAEDMSSIMRGVNGLAILMVGFFYPVIVYIWFLLIFAIADILLAVLSIKDINTKVDQKKD
ncbi:MAG: hypothetical protein CMM44_09890 [Rhodospirillaceae bacterium]|nr:hypothetical protein [Rhodospirillaceae bacterium]